MVEYLCHRCGYIAGQRINLKHHLNRKKKCKPILADISIEEIKKHYNLDIKNMNPNEYSAISKFIEWLNINSHESNIDDYFPGFEIN